MKKFTNFIQEEEEKYTGIKPDATDLIRISDANHYFKKYQAEQLILSGVSKSFTYRDITDVAEDLANDYCNDVTDPVWRDIRQDGIKAIQAFISKHL